LILPLSIKSVISGAIGKAIPPQARGVASCKREVVMKKHIRLSLAKIRAHFHLSRASKASVYC